MTKTQEMAAAFLQRTQQLQPVPVRNSINAFNALFAVQDLTDQEERSIEQILLDGCEPGDPVQERVPADALEIKKLTKELKAIKRQELVLIGERIAEAREVFRKYKKRSLREWMDFTFGSFKTGYNYLAFYDLYTAFPDELRGILKDMPAKAIYVLASKDMPIETKMDIVRTSPARETASNLITRIQNSLGMSDHEKPPGSARILNALEKAASLLHPDRIDPLQRSRLIRLVDYLKEMIVLSEK